MAPYYTVHEFSDDCKSTCITGKLNSLVKAYIIAQECGTRKVVRFLDGKDVGDTVWSNKRGIFYKNTDPDESKILESLTLDAANEIQSHLFQLGVHRKMKHEHYERLDSIAQNLIWACIPRFQEVVSARKEFNKVWEARGLQRSNFDMLYFTVNRILDQHINRKYAVYYVTAQDTVPIYVGTYTSEIKALEVARGMPYDNYIAQINDKHYHVMRTIKEISLD
jgi:hypothetical protein